MSSKELVEWCRYAERKGFGYAFRSDHFLSIPAGETDSPECWTSLGAIAASTRKIRFGTMVTPTSYRNPALLAKMARTINSLSNGRLMFGLGAGWYEREYRAYGYPFPDLSTRIEQFKEALGIIIPMTVGEKVLFTGKYFNANVEALQKSKIHVIIGGRPPEVVEQAARLADEWNIYACTIDRYLQCKRVFDSALSDRRVVVSHTGPVVIAENKRGLVKHVEGRLRETGGNGSPDTEIEKMKKRGILCGTPGEIVSQINKKKELGVDRFYLEVDEMKTKEMANLLTDTLKRV